MRIADDKIDEVRNASDIVEVISGYVHLKKRGKNYLGLCPFQKLQYTAWADIRQFQLGQLFAFGFEEHKQQSKCVTIGGDSIIAISSPGYEIR